MRVENKANRVVKVEIVVFRGLGALLEAHAVAVGVALPELGAVWGSKGGEGEAKCDPPHS